MYNGTCMYSTCTGKGYLTMRVSKKEWFSLKSSKVVTGPPSLVGGSSSELDLSHSSTTDIIKVFGLLVTFIKWMPWSISLLLGDHVTARRLI